MLLKIVIFISLEPILCHKRLSSKPSQRLKKFICSKIDRHYFFEKNSIFKKIETSSIKMLKIHPLPPSSYVLTYCQTLDEVTWLPRQETLKKKRQMLKDKLDKIANLIKNFLKLEILNCPKTIPLAPTTVQ